MLRIKVSSLKPGAKLGKDIYSCDATLLLGKGTVITNEHLKSFASRGIDEIFVLESNLQSKPRKNFADVFTNTLDIVHSNMLQIQLGKKLDYEEMDEAVDLLVEQVFDVNDLFRHMRLMKNKDEYLYTHSINVALLAILIGRWMKCDQTTIKEIGMAGVLHDIGKVFIDNKILNKPGKLTAEEYQIVKSHTTLGYNLLSQDKQVSEEVCKAALMHHERTDGSGYPMGLHGRDIGFYASVVAVADVYDALTSDRSYSSKVSPYIAVEVLWDESFGKLDPHIVKVFYDKITSFYIGNEVILSNNMRGVVVYLNPSQPTRPIVMVEDEFVDLAIERKLYIMEVID